MIAVPVVLLNILRIVTLILFVFLLIEDRTVHEVMYLSTVVVGLTFREKYSKKSEGRK